jgi:3-deoxy-7-phosphoheptulonate synthase
MLWIRLDDAASAASVAASLQGLGLWASPLEDASGATTGFSVADFSAAIDLERLRRVEGVAEVQRPRSAHPLVDATCGNPVNVGSLQFCPEGPAVLMAGPCSVESAQQADELAALVAAAGGAVLRGGAFKPRSSPHSFSGHGAKALTWLRRAADRHGMAVVTEVLGEADVAPVAEIADLLQVGSRNMQNFALLRAIGGRAKPVLLKRGMAATVEEWLLAAEHLLQAGAAGVVYCARGISGFDPQTRNLLDLGSVALLAEVYKLPVIVDPSHAVGRRDLIPALGRAALAAGACGLLVEVHADPARALSDGAQALLPDQLGQFGFAP